MKEIIAYEDTDGIRHDTKKACLLADAEIAVLASMKKCTAPDGAFFPAEWFSRVSKDIKLQRALIVVLGIDMAKLQADMLCNADE